MDAAKKVSLKLLINTKERRVLFAEAGKDFVDFLFSILTLPVGSVIRILAKGKMVGSLGNLYHSIQQLSDSYMEGDNPDNKESLLNPKLAVDPKLLGYLLPDPAASSPIPTKKVYVCWSSCREKYVSHNLGTRCPNCGSEMNTEATFVDSPGGVRKVNVDGESGNEGGYVKAVVTYTVMDDLAVKPMSTISSIALLNQFNVKDLGSLEEQVIEVGMNQALELLEASLKSKSVLTDVFLKKNETL